MLTETTAVKDHAWFDVVGQGLASEHSLVEAMEYAKDPDTSVQTGGGRMSRRPHRDRAGHAATSSHTTDRTTTRNVRTEAITDRQ